MRLNLVGPFVVNAPFGTEIAFAKGLRRLGHEVVEVDPNVNPHDAYKGMARLTKRADATLVFKSCCGYEDYLDDLAHPIIVYQPDDARFAHIREMMLMMRKSGADLFLSFDGHGADVARTMGYKAAETLLLTADDELYCPSPEPVERDIDVSFIGSLGDPIAHASRRKMLEIVSQEASHRGWNTAFYNTQDIPAILDIYRRSKVVLNHATDVGQRFGTGFGLQCRHFEVGMTRTALLSNHLLASLGTRNSRDPNCQEQRSWDDDCPTFQKFANEESLIFRLNEMLKPSGSWQRDGEILYGNIMAKHKPEHRAEMLVNFIRRHS